MWQSTRREVLHAALGTTALAALPFTSCTSSMRHYNGTERVVIFGESDERFYRGVTVITPAMSLPPLSP